MGLELSMHYAPSLNDAKCNRTCSDDFTNSATESYSYIRFDNQEILTNHTIIICFSPKIVNISEITWKRRKISNYRTFNQC